MKPNNVEMSELGADKGLLQGLYRAKRQVIHALKIPELPESFQESPFIGKVRFGHGWLLQILGVRSFVPEVRSQSGHDMSVNLTKEMLFSVLTRRGK